MLLAPYINSKLSQILDKNLRDSFHNIKQVQRKEIIKKLPINILPFKDLLTKITRRNIFSELKEYLLKNFVNIIN